MTKNPIGSKPEHFQYLGLLGKGGFAEVHRAKCLQPGMEEVEVAIKEISRKKVDQKKLQDRVKQELNIHPQLQHPSIVKLYTTFEDKDNIYLVLEYCENGTLSNYLKSKGRLSEAEAHGIIKEVLEGLLYLHSKNIIHRDLSLGNILLKKDMKIKIADFGLSTQLSRPDEKKYTMLGTANFMSPEQVMRSPHGKEVDIWALGCVLYALLVGKPPFDGERVVEIFKNAIISDVKIPDYVSKEAKKLIYDLCTKDPRHRINLNDAFKSSFFTKYKTNPQREKKLDSGIGSTSSSTVPSVGLSCRSTGTLDSGMSSACNRDARRSRSPSRNVACMDTIHSMSCSYHSDDHLNAGCKYTNCRGQVQSCPKSPPSKLKRSKSRSGFVRQLKDKLQALPPRIEFHSPPTLEVSSNREGRERSASEERRKQERQRMLYQDTESFPRQMKERSEKNARLYNVQDYQIRSCPQSPIPYPWEHLESKIDEHLFKSFISSCESGNPSKSNICTSNCGYNERLPKVSCSHDRYCSDHCSHEIVCRCRKAQECDNRSHHSKEYHSSSPHRKPEERKSLKDIVRPLSTTRLGPKRHVTKNAVISVLSDGQVCLEFLKTKNHKKYVSNVYFISADGMRIFLYKTNGQFLVSDEPPPIPENPKDMRCFTYENLPEVHWKKYIFASRFVNIIKAKTAKIILYTKRAKFIMMENSPDPDFEMSFYDGGKITKVSDKIVIVNKDGKVGDVENLDEDLQTMYEEFVILKTRCEKLEKTLESLETDDLEESYFPAIIGKKPFSPLLEVKGKENVTTPPSMRTSAFNKAIENMQSYPHSTCSPLENSKDTTCSPYENSRKPFKSQPDQKHRFHRERTFFKRSMEDILANLKGIPKVVDGKVVAEYKDGIEMWSTQDARKVYFYDRQSGKKLTDVRHNHDLLKRICLDLKGILLHEHERRKTLR